MFALIRKNRHPTPLRRLVSSVYRDFDTAKKRQVSWLPSHHILCAGTYTPVFARLAAESALAACPEELRTDFRLFIHVDGLDARKRKDLMAWLGEIPGVELTYGIFGILSRDRIPGKWHQTMISDVVRLFSGEPHVAFIDADLFLHGESWFKTLGASLADDVYSISAGLRHTRVMQQDERQFVAIKTNLFSVNTAAHLRLNQQRSSKDGRAVRLLAREFPEAHLSVPAVDSMVVGSLRAQAHGFKVLDVDRGVEYCHVGGFSHLRVNKFDQYQSPETREVIDSWLARLRLMSRVLAYFDTRGWDGRVEAGYRKNIAEALDFVARTEVLAQRFSEVEATRHEVVFDAVLRDGVPL